MTQFEPQAPMAEVPAGAALAPHRGVTILVLGLVGIFCCFFCGIAAWVMASSDLSEMAAGRMDRSGEDMTKAGKILGIISVALLVIGPIVCGLVAALRCGFDALMP